MNEIKDIAISNLQRGVRNTAQAIGIGLVVVAEQVFAIENLTKNIVIGLAVILLAKGLLHLYTAVKQGENL